MDNCCAFERKCQKCRGSRRRRDRGAGCFETRLCLEELPPLVHGRLPPQGPGTASHGLSKPQETFSIVIRTKKSPRKSFFLDNAKHAAYQCTVTAKRSRNGVNFLSMSAGSELEPAPSWSGQQCSQKMCHPLGVQMMSREAQTTARAVGWGGFTS